MSDPSLLLLPWVLAFWILSSGVPRPGRSVWRPASRSGSRGRGWRRGLEGIPVRPGRASRYVLRDGIELVPDVFAGRHVASAMTAAHEAAHAVQVRGAGGRWLTYPYAAGRLAFPLCVLAVLATALTGYGVPTALAISLASIPLVLFVVLVEVDADRRALGLLDESGLLRDLERRKAAVLLIRARAARWILWALVPAVLSLWLAQTGGR